MISAAAVVLAVGYLAAVTRLRARGIGWPGARTAAWAAGLAAALAAGTGPVAAAAHHDLRAHMLQHLLLGMLAPLLLVLGRPVTLALRALPVEAARRLARFLRLPPIRVLTHPVTAAVLDGGGLWLLYTTDLHAATATRPWLSALIQLHLLLAGYLFTAAIIGRDPAPHRPGPWTRGAVLVAFLAAHGILAKHLYAGGMGQAAQLMYYGGDLLHVAVIVIFCRQWYVATAPQRPARRPEPALRAWRLPDSV